MLTHPQLPCGEQENESLTRCHVLVELTRDAGRPMFGAERNFRKRGSPTIIWAHCKEKEEREEKKQNKTRQLCLSNSESEGRQTPQDLVVA